MKTFQAIVLLLAVFVASNVSAFAPPTSSTRPAFKASSAPLSMSPKEEAPVKTSEEAKQDANPNAAAVAAFATAMAPLAAQAQDADEGAVIGFGVGLVACVVSLAVGFSVGYGTLIKP